MKPPISAVFLFAFVFAIGRADPGEDLDAGIRALLKQPNFSWTVTFERAENGQRQAYDGKTERGGFTVVTTARRNLLETDAADVSERPVLIVFAGDHGVVKLDDAWLTPREFYEMVHGNSGAVATALAMAARVAAGGAALGSQTKTTVWDEEGRIYLPRPDLILSALLGELENAKESGRAISADITERAVIGLFESKLAVPDVDRGRVIIGVSMSGPSRRTTTSSKTGRTTTEVVPTTPVSRPPMVPSRIVRYQDGNGAGTFWIVDGMLAKFELRLEAAERGRGATEGASHHVVITAILNDAGATVVEVPDGARQRLGR